MLFFFFSSRRRHTRWPRDWSSDVCSSDLEPGEAMLGQLRHAVPRAEALLGAAENIPLADDSVDALTVGQAFHWFRHDEALPELHRVLRTGGGIALVWNWRDQDQPLQREVNELVARFVPPGRPH